MASVPVYCLCRLPYDVTRFMIECDGCQDWFHGSCVGVEEEAAADIDQFHCPQCQLQRGPSVMKHRRGGGPAKEAEPGRQARTGPAPTGPARTGSAPFIRELRSRSFPSAEEVLLRPSGAQLTVEYLEEKSFSVPILVARKEGLGMTLPPPTFTPKDVEHYVGAGREVEVLDVGSQAGLRMPLGDFISYLGGARRDRVLSLTSLEFSDTRLSNLVEAPRIVRKLSWVENLWPGEAGGRPSLQKFCLLGARQGYSDFSVAWGGTSAWCHVLRGEQIFFLARPSCSNLALFEAWRSSRRQPELFFGDQVDRCFRCPLRQGQTLFIPSGWIQAVLTPVDCLAFGGFFLHSLNIPMQLRAYELERRLSPPELCCFPNFEAICWYVGRHLLDTFRGLRENRRPPASYLLHGAKALTAAFRAWTRKEVLGQHQQQIPESLRPGQLIRELAKEIRLVEELFQQGAAKAGPPYGPPRGVPSKDPPPKKGAPPQPPRKPPPSQGGPPKALLEQPEEEGDPQSSSPEETDPESEGGDPHILLANGRARGGLRRCRRPPPAGGSLWGGRCPPPPPSPPPSPPPELDSEEDLQIDEAPPRRPPRRLPRLPRKLPRAKPCSDPNRVREPGEVDFDIEEDYTTEEEEGGGSAAGLLDLLKASRRVGGAECPPLSEAPASPSTREAIQGMLSMANLPAGSPPLAPPNWGPERGGGGGGGGGAGGVGGGRRAPLPPAPGSTESEEEEEEEEEEEGSGDEQDSLGACFKDAEYIYPSLESDEDDPALKSLPKKRKVTDDAPWSPKARVTPSLPRQSRPVREGTRVASVETGLAAAAAKLAQQEHRKLQRRKGPPKRRPPPSPPSPEEEEEEEGEEEEEESGLGVGGAEAEPPQYPPSLADHEYTARPAGGGAAPPTCAAGGGAGPPQAGKAPTPMAPGVFLTQRRAPHAQPPAPQQGKRPKKGLATAKQRLGRILKIHRNGKLLL